MPTIKNYSSFGTILKVGDGKSPQVFTSVGQIQSITFAGVTFKTADVTCHDQGQAVEKLRQTLLVLGTIAFSVVADPQNRTHQWDPDIGLQWMFRNSIVRAWQLITTDPSGITRQFDAFVETLNEKFDVAGVNTWDVVIKPQSYPSPV